MKPLFRFALEILAAGTVLAGCGGSQPPVVAPDTAPQASASGTHAARGGSWMLPEAQSGDLVYAATGLNAGTVAVLSYPGLKPVGTLSGFTYPQGICADKAGDVWIVNTSPAEVIEYAHGGTTPIGTLSVAGYGTPDGCAVDPTTGNLAVMGDDFLSIFPSAENPPTTYQLGSHWHNLQNGAYDSDGNFFAVGYYAVQSRWKAELAELPRGGNGVEAIMFNQDVYASTAQWSGRSLIIGGAGLAHAPVEIYRVAVSGSKAKIVRTTELKRHQGKAIFGQFWIQGNRIIEGINRNLGVWRYPQGGFPVRDVPCCADGVHGVAVSLPPSRSRVRE